VDDEDVHAPALLGLARQESLESFGVDLHSEIQVVVSQLRPKHWIISLAILAKAGQLQPHVLTKALWRSAKQTAKFTIYR
jgi:hypothetical protein